MLLICMLLTICVLILAGMDIEEGRQEGFTKKSILYIAFNILFGIFFMLSMIGRVS